MNQPLKLPTDGFSGDDLKFVEGLNEVFQKANLASVNQIEKAINEVKSEFANVVKSDVLASKIDELKQLYANQNAELLALKENGSNKKQPTSFAEKTWAALTLNADKIKNLGRSGMIEIISAKSESQLKAAGTMTTANITPVGTNAIPFELASIESGITRIQRRSPFLFQICNIGRVNNMYVQWAEQANPDPGVAGSTSEGAAKTQTDFDIVEKSQKVEKVTAFIKVSKELLDDVSMIQQEINTELRELVLLKMDELVLIGTGTSPEIKGISQFAPAWAAAPFANKINNANNFDVLRVGINQIEKNNFYPTDILMHPSDIAAMELTKNAQDSYIMPPFSSIDGTVIKGLKVHSNTGVPEGEFVIGDFTKANLRIREDFSLSMGHVNADYTNNLVTILAEMRAVFFIKSNHVNAFVKGAFTTAKAALETP